MPLLSQPVRLERSLLGYRVVPAGDVEVTPLVADPELAAAFEDAPGLATPGWLEAIGSGAWLRSVADATGFTVGEMIGPKGRIPAEGLVLVAAPALFVVRDVFGGGLADSLRSWAGRDLSATALAAVYGESGTGASDTGATGSDHLPVLSPLPLTGPQERVVIRARSEPVTVVSGPPGSGKSHTVVAAALEVVDRGGSVLVATQSPHAAEVLAGLLARYPGSTPVLFGDAGGRAGLEAELAAGADQGVEAGVIRSGRARVKAAHAAVRGRSSEIVSALDIERAAATLPEHQPRLPELSADVPGAFTDALDRIRALLAVEPGTGWWSRRRARSARRKAFRLLGAAESVPEEIVSEALAAATAQRAAAHLAATGGTDLTTRWAALHDAERELRELVGQAMRDGARSAERWSRDARRAARRPGRGVAGRP
nr:hypothetical protein GCM10020092_078710 [Actinoplanes digitatis]